MITLGDKGKEVSKLQKLLSLIGYDLIMDGYFGSKTLRSLKAFQKKYNLVIDGIAGVKTMSVLKAAQKRTSKENKEIRHDKNYGNIPIDILNHIDSEQFIKQSFNKDKIFIQSTESGPNSKNAIKYWGDKSRLVSSAFVIASDYEDGKIYETFNPDYWGFHLGVKGTNGKIERSSISIKLCSWGKLIKKNNKFYNIYGDEISDTEVYTLQNIWRGSYYYHKYSDKQLGSLEKILTWIKEEYKIPVQDIIFNENWIEYNESLIKDNTPGIWTQSNVRKDVADIYPDYRLFDILNRIKS